MKNVYFPFHLQKRKTKIKLNKSETKNVYFPFHLQKRKTNKKLLYHLSANHFTPHKTVNANCLVETFCLGQNSTNSKLNNAVDINNDFTVW